MKTKELIRQLQEADSSGEEECVVGNADSPIKNERKSMTRLRLCLINAAFGMLIGLPTWFVLPPADAAKVVKTPEGSVSIDGRTIKFRGDISYDWVQESGSWNLVPVYHSNSSGSPKCYMGMSCSNTKGRRGLKQTAGTIQLDKELGVRWQLLKGSTVKAQTTIYERTPAFLNTWRWGDAVWFTQYNTDPDDNWKIRVQVFKDVNGSWVEKGSVTSGVLTE